MLPAVRRHEEPFAPGHSPSSPRLAECFTRIAMHRRRFSALPKSIGELLQIAKVRSRVPGEQPAHAFAPQPLNRFGRGASNWHGWCPMELLRGSAALKEEIGNMSEPVVPPTSSKPVVPAASAPSQPAIQPKQAASGQGNPGVAAHKANKQQRRSGIPGSAR